MANLFRASRENVVRPPNQEMRLDRLTAQGHLAEWHVEAAIVDVAIASARVFVLVGSVR